MIGRRGFLGMLAGALGAVGLDSVPGLAHVVRRLTPRIRKLAIQDLVLEIEVRLNGKMWHGFLDNSGSLTPWSLQFTPSLLLRHGESLEVFTRSERLDRAIYRALLVWNEHGTLHVEKPCVGTPTVVVEMCRGERPPPKSWAYQVEWEESPST